MGQINSPSIPQQGGGPAPVSTEPMPSLQQEGVKFDDLPEWARDPKKFPVKFEPCQDLVIVFPDPINIKSRGGVLRGSITRGEMKPSGTVIAAGPGKNSDFTGEFIPNDWVKKGERYCYSKYAGDDMIVDSEGNLSPWLGFLPDDHVLVKIMRSGSLLALITE